MNLQQIGDQLQKLVNHAFEREKTIPNIVLGVAADHTDNMWSGAAGEADPSTGRSMQPQTPYLIASVTKMYTAAALMILQERGTLALDDKISKYLPGELIQGLHHHRGVDYTHLLTIRHLISQTSGLPDYFLERPKGGKSVYKRLLSEGDRGWTLEDVVRLTREDLPSKFVPPDLADGSPESRARIKAHYSDTNYKLLGAIIESVTQKPLRSVFAEFFFEPLNLRQTYLYGFPQTADVDEPALLFYKEKPLVLDRFLKTHGPEGGIVSTVADAIRFGKAFMDGGLFSRSETLEKMQCWHRIFYPFQYGYGLMRFKLPKILSPFSYSPELVGHSGASGSFFYYCRDLRLYMAGTINQMTLPNVPFRLMIKVCGLVNRLRS